MDTCEVTISVKALDFISNHLNYCDGCTAYVGEGEARDVLDDDDPDTRVLCLNCQETE